MSPNWFDKYIDHAPQDPYIGRLQNAVEKSMYVGPAGRALTNHADQQTAGQAGDFIDAWLTAKTTVRLFDHPGGSVKSVVPAGQLVGIIASFVISDGSIWWQMESQTGGQLGWLRQVQGETTPSGGWGTEDKNDREQMDENEQGVFDKIFDGLGSLANGAGDSLKTLGDSMDKIVIIAIVGIMIYVFFFAKKTLAAI